LGRRDRAIAVLKILVLSNRVPFVWGGAEELSFHLVRRLKEAGHQAEEMRLPFSWNPAERLIEEMVIARSVRLTNVDRVIALKFPSYLVPHRNQVIWLLHQFRQAYDLFDSGQSHIERTPEGDAIRSAIRTADEAAFRSACAVYALPNAARRVKQYNGVDAAILSQPLNDPELFAGGEDNGFILAAGRIGDAKRQSLLIEALPYAPGVRLVLAGPPDGPSVFDSLQALAQRCGVADRVTFDLRFLPRQELAELVNGCTASAYVPFDEDSVAYVTMEAFQAGKPVITCTDSGGLLEIVIDGETGLVVEPRAETLGRAMADMIADRSRAARMGAAGRSLLVERDVTWPKTLEKLLG
jgi:glycosyltransferase involved in cell wall biosynthesis